MILSLGLVPALLLILGFPIFLVLLTASVVALLFFLNTPLEVLHLTIVQVLSSPALLAIPFFVFAGELMSRGSIAKRLIDLVESAASPVRGNLAVTTVATSAIFGAISGVSAAAVVTIGRFMYPAMLKSGYPKPFAAGLVTSTGALDIIIPPSVAMIIYSIMADESVPRLYAAGVIPGLLLASMLCAYVIWRSWRGDYGSTSPWSLSRILMGLKNGVWALGMPFIIFAGIYGGVFSPTEAAAVSCVYAAAVARFIYRDLTVREILAAAERTVNFSAQILIIAACAGIFSWLLTINQVPAAIVGWLQDIAVPLWLLLLLINVILLVIGCFLDPLSTLVLVTALLVPIVKAAGIDTVHFGIIMTVNLAIGLFTPPIGMNIFVAQSVLKIPLAPIYRGIVPLLFVYLIALMLITYVPGISLYGVKLLMGVQ